MYRDAAIQKQRATEKELTELRRQHEKLMQKLNRLSVVFNDFKGVIEDEPIKTVAPYRSSLSLPSTRKDGTSSSPSTSSQTAQLGTHRTAFSLDPGSHESIIGFADTTTSSSSSAPSPSSSSAQSQSSSTSSPKNPPVRPPRYTYNTHIQRASDINNANNLHTSSGINKTTDIHDHTIEVFLRAQKTYCNNLQLIVEVYISFFLILLFLFLPYHVLMYIVRCSWSRSAKKFSTPPTRSSPSRMYNTYFHILR